MHILFFKVHMCLCLYSKQTDSIAQKCCCHAAAAAAAADQQMAAVSGTDTCCLVNYYYTLHNTVHSLKMPLFAIFNRVGKKLVRVVNNNKIKNILAVLVCSSCCPVGPAGPDQTFSVEKKFFQRFVPIRCCFFLSPFLSLSHPPHPSHSRV